MFYVNKGTSSVPFFVFEPSVSFQQHWIDIPVWADCWLLSAEY